MTYVCTYIQHTICTDAVLNEEKNENGLHFTVTQCHSNKFIRVTLCDSDASSVYCILYTTLDSLCCETRKVNLSNNTLFYQ